MVVGGIGEVAARDRSASVVRCALQGHLSNDTDRKFDFHNDTHPMGALVVVCPIHQKKFGTGIQIGRESLGEMDAATIAISFCPYCRQTHEWRYGEAEYMDALLPSGRISVDVSRPRSARGWPLILAVRFQNRTNSKPTTANPAATIDQSPKSNPSNRSPANIFALILSAIEQILK